MNKDKDDNLVVCHDKSVYSGQQTQALLDAYLFVLSLEGKYCHDQKDEPNLCAVSAS